jgi:polar amino acid transport system permease protein
MLTGTHFHRISRTKKLLQVFEFAGLLVFLTWLMYNGTESLGYNWQWYRIPRYILEPGPGLVPGPLLQGLGVTLKITAVGLLLTIVFGLTTALFRLSGSLTANLLARFYLETIRNTPLMIQLLFNYFVLSPILGINSFWTAVITLALFEGAYASEIIRAGITSVEHGQWEAGRSIGLSEPQTYTYIIIPQTLKLVLPPITSQSVSLIKDSALVSTIAIYDLTMQGQALISKTFLTFEIWFTVAGIYLLLALSISGLIRFLDPGQKAHRQT